MPESSADRQARARKILTILRRKYANAECALVHDSAWQLLISTILSAQSTDDNVNRVTAALYRKYTKPADFLKVALTELEQDIHASGFYRQKARNIQGTCRILVDKYTGEVPDDLDALIELPGVARKTANVVLGTWFGKNEGVVVDTHVGRIAHRLRLTWSSRDSKDAVKIERDLMEVLPRRSWTFWSHAMIWHGRGVCTARRPDCEDCALARWCPSAFNAETVGRPIKKTAQRSPKKA